MSEVWLLLLVLIDTLLAVGLEPSHVRDLVLLPVPSDDAVVHPREMLSLPILLVIFPLALINVVVFLVDFPSLALFFAIQKVSLIFQLVL